jgi:toxin-antitoxin system PIN domain toxin
MKLVDANVLLYAVHEEAEHHPVALTWLDRSLSGNETVLLPWMCLIAFIRLSTHPAVYERPQTVADSLEIVEAWLGLSNVVTDQPDGHHARRIGDVLQAAGGRGNLVNDAHLAALAMQYDATVISYDEDFSRFPGVRWERPH